jgi:hypothetical protein
MNNLPGCPLQRAALAAEAASPEREVCRDTTKPREDRCSTTAWLYERSFLPTTRTILMPAKAIAYPVTLKNRAKVLSIHPKPLAENEFARTKTPSPDQHRSRGTHQPADHKISR